MSAERRIECPQLVYSWATKTIDGVGYGVVGHSTDWTPRVTTKDGNLGSLAAFLPKNRLSLATGPGAALRSIELMEHESLGRVLVKKTYLGTDTAGRPGRYVVHIARLGNHPLTAREALALGRSSQLLDDWAVDAEPSRALAPLALRVVATTPKLPGTSRPLLVAMIAGVLDHLASARPAVLVTRDQKGVEDAFVRTMQLLPTGLTVGLSFSTFQSAPKTSRADVTLASVENSELVSAGDLEHDYVALEHDLGLPMPSAESDRLADELVGLFQDNEFAPADITDIAGLQRWVLASQSVAVPPSDLRDDEVLAIAASNAFARWLSIPGASERAVRWMTANRKSLAVPPSGLDDDVRAAVSAGLLSAVRDAVTRAPADAAGLGAVAAKWGATQKQVDVAIQTGLRSALESGGIVAAHARAFGSSLDEVLAAMRADQLLELADRSDHSSYLMERWSPLTLAIATATWNDLDWVLAHQSLAAKVARDFAAQTAAGFPFGAPIESWPVTINSLAEREARELVALVARTDLGVQQRLWLASQFSSAVLREPLLDDLRSPAPQRPARAARPSPRAPRPASSHLGLIALSYLASTTSIVCAALAMVYRSPYLVGAVFVLMLVGWVPLLVAIARTRRRR